MDIRNSELYQLNQMVDPHIRAMGHINWPINMCINQNGEVLLNESVNNAISYYTDQMNRYAFYHFTPDIINELVNKVLRWKNLRTLYTHNSVIYGITMDGIVLTAGKWFMKYKKNGYDYNEYYDMRMTGLMHIFDISIGDTHVIALRTDGRTIATGLNVYGECHNVLNWKDIVQVSAGRQCSFGLKSDGTVVYCGNITKDVEEVSNWNNIVRIRAGINSVFGLKSDGTIVVAGKSNNFQERFLQLTSEIKTWNNIIYFDYRYMDDQFVAIDSNGDVHIAGTKKMPELYNEGILAVNWHGVSYNAVKKDGSVIQVTPNGINTMPNLRIFDDLLSYKNIIQSRQADANRKEIQYDQNIANGVCMYCGGKFKGLFTKKCSLCGEIKSY